MASKLSNSISSETPLDYVGRLLWHDPTKSILDFGSNRIWRRLRRRTIKKISELSFYDLTTLIAPNSRDSIHDDFMQLSMSAIGEAKALERLRHLIVENYVCRELIRVAADFSKPLISPLPQVLSELIKRLEEKERLNQIALDVLSQKFTYQYLAPAIQWPQFSPNAPNTPPALSLAAA